MSYPEGPPDCWCSRKAHQLEGENRALEILVKGLDEKLAQMRSAVKAAEAWADGGSHAALTDAVKVWRKLKKAWS